MRTHLAHSGPASCSVHFNLCQTSETDSCGFMTIVTNMWLMTCCPPYSLLLTNTSHFSFIIISLLNQFLLKTCEAHKLNYHLNGLVIIQFV